MVDSAGLQQILRHLPNIFNGDALRQEEKEDWSRRLKSRQAASCPLSDGRADPSSSALLPSLICPESDEKPQGLNLMSLLRMAVARDHPRPLNLFRPKPAPPLQPYWRQPFLTDDNHISLEG